MGFPLLLSVICGIYFENLTCDNDFSFPIGLVVEVHHAWIFTKWLLWQHAWFFEWQVLLIKAKASVTWMEIAAKQKFGDYLLRIKPSDHSFSDFTVESQTWALPSFFSANLYLDPCFKPKVRKEKKIEFFATVQCLMHLLAMHLMKSLIVCIWSWFQCPDSG